MYFTKKLLFYFSLQTIVLYRNSLYQMSRHHPLKLSIYFIHTSPSIKIIYLFHTRFSVTNSIHTCLRVLTLQNFYIKNQSFKSLSRQNEHVSIYNVIRKKILLYNHLSISIFKLKFYLKNFRSNMRGIT